MSPKKSDSASEKPAAGKGRPTPKRKVAEQANVSNRLAPASTKAGKKLQREQLRQQRVQTRAAYMRGEESAMPPRDRGQVKRFIRNYVDARRSIGEYFLPIIFVVLVLTLIQIPAVQFGAIALMYVVLLVAVVDGIFLGRKIQRLVHAKYPSSSTKGLAMYAWLRSTQMRRLRAPHPQSKVGDVVN